MVPFETVLLTQFTLRISDTTIMNGLAAFQQRPNPCEHSRPTAIAFSDSRMSSEPTVTKAKHRAACDGL